MDDAERVADYMRSQGFGREADLLKAQAVVIESFIRERELMNGVVRACLGLIEPEPEAKPEPNPGSINDAVRRIMREGGTPFQIEQRLTRYFVDREAQTVIGCAPMSANGHSVDSRAQRNK